MCEILHFISPFHFRLKSLCTLDEPPDQTGSPSWLCRWAEPLAETSAGGLPWEGMGFTKIWVLGALSFALFSISLSSAVIESQILPVTPMRPDPSGSSRMRPATLGGLDVNLGLSFYPAGTLSPGRCSGCGSVLARGEAMQSECSASSCPCHAPCSLSLVQGGASASPPPPP